MFSDKILELRLAKNWTQAELSDASGVKQPLIAGYEHGKKPSKKTIEKLAKGFGMTVEEFLKVKSKKNANVEEIDIKDVVSQVRTLPYKYQNVVREEVLRLLSLHQFEQDQKRLENMVLRRKSTNE